jgi:ectoine hydroxylase-related dioxygenase (phytanoyl-CoA dioxygenase family)
MNLPVLDDTPLFGFLTCLKKVSWMHIVRTLLGPDAVLIHKGMFLSLPGSAKQTYHQDGTHLTHQPISKTMSCY